MNNTDLLRDQLSRHPDDETLYNAYCDALQDELDWTPESASAQAQEVRSGGFRARTLAEATHLMTKGTNSRRLLLPEIYRTSNTPRGTRPWIYLLPDSSLPAWSRVWTTSGHRSYYVESVTVGAGWVTSWWETRPIAPRRKRSKTGRRRPRR